MFIRDVVQAEDVGAIADDWWTVFLLLVETSDGEGGARWSGEDAAELPEGDAAK